MKNQIGVIGMAVMGKNIALNFNDHGYRVAIYNRTTSVTEEVAKEHPELKAYTNLKEFVESLEKPRKILLMVKAGQPVDAFIEGLLEHVQENDIIMDGGNSYYHDSVRRYEELRQKNIRFSRVGISGGEEGAHIGPSITLPGITEASSYVSPV